MNWKTYVNGRLISQHSSGFFVIKPAEMNNEVTPIFCPLCDCVMNSTYDEDAYRQFECCDACSSLHARPNSVMWKEGWRPSREDVINKRNAQLR